LLVENGKVTAETIAVKSIPNELNVAGNLTVQGEITATKLHVNEVSADVRNERTSNLEFKGANGAVGKGLIWTGGEYTKQFTLQADRLFSSEDFDLNKEKVYKINNQTVMSETALGEGVTASNLTTVGVLENLETAGRLTIDGSIFWDADSERLGIFTDAPNGLVSVGNFDHEFVIDAHDTDFKIGTWTTTGLHIITDDTTRIKIDSNGKIQLNDKVSIAGTLGVGVKNFADDASITTAGPIRMQGKKFESASSAPRDGVYSKGDIVWNDDPKPTGSVGWVCVRSGTPGDWKSFGQIAQ